MGQIEEAKNLQKGLRTFAMIVNCLELLIFYNIRDKMILIFTTEERLLELTNSVMIVALIVIAQDFQQGSMYGTLKALGQQTNSMYVNIVTYYVLVIPFSFYFAFHCRILDNGTKPLGVMGLWLGFVIGLLHQIIMYHVLIENTDWFKACKEARKRQAWDLPVNTHHSQTFISSMRSFYKIEEH